ncbi:hypothetical protein [Caldimonas brevitalea]|uniref:hypothetical protein n=1 Tax=Caldimonas brevitalea TaxID=413882 RepID=UPI001EEDA3B1|nr:hypothetical protein [Caldimonas brevitalea]
MRNADGLRIFDVYYSEAGEPIATHVAPTYVYGETVSDLYEQMLLMMEALEQPVLDEAEIGRMKDLNEHE